jgi:hypothetical protein
MATLEGSEDMEEARDFSMASTSSKVALSATTVGSPGRDSSSSTTDGR